MIQLKNEEDIERIRQSSALLNATFQVLEQYIQPGVTTREIDAAARTFIERNGGRPAFLGYMDYPASICASVNETVIHGIPNGKKLCSGDILSLDLGVDLGGYFSDAAWTYPLGTVSEDVRRLLDVTKECLDLSVRNAIAGNRIQDISRAVFDYADSHGYGVVHQFCGHGVGFALHEDPQVPNYVGRGSNPRIKAGMVLALEPMINLGGGDVKVLDDDWTVVTADGTPSAHFEHTAAVYQDRTEILTLRS